MANPQLTVHVIETWRDLGLLQAEWDAFLRRSRADSLFLTWAWMEAWRDVMGDRVRPFVLVAREGSGRLAGLAPLYLARYRFLQVLPCRALRVLGDYHSGAEYGDWIVDPGRETEVAAALAGALASARHRWDVLWMPYVAEFTGARDRVTLSCSAARLRTRERTVEFSAIALPSDFAVFRKALSANARSSLQRQTRKAHDLGLTLEACTDPAELGGYIDALDMLNHRRWSTEGLQGTFRRKPLELAFYRRFAREALPRGWLRYFALKQGPEFRAVQAGYSYNGSFLQLQEGFDPGGPPGLGNVLRLQIIESCIREGLITYDFLGEQTEHKRRWQGRVRPGRDLLVTHGRPLSALLGRAGIWPSGRFLRQCPLPPGDARRRLASPCSGWDGA